MKYIAVIGSRYWNDYNTFLNKLSYYIKDIEDDITFVSGGAESGADALIEKFCEENDVPIIIYPAKWTDIEGKKPYEIGVRKDGTQYYKLAGLDRNINIIAKSNFVIAFWDGRSTGTEHGIGLAKGTNKPIRIVKI